MADELLTGWGRSTWSRAEVHSPRSAHDVPALITAANGGVIARGMGRAYGDQATNAGGRVLDMTGLTGTDPQPDADGRVTVSAGMSIDALLRSIVPQGWFVPVTAGTRHITVGGAIAADIHGRNHHRDGTFCTHVDEMQLMLADGTTRRCSPRADADLFWATAGGMGLTGVIIEATVRLKAIETSRVLVDTTRFTDLDSLLVAMTEADEYAHYSVSWIDLMMGGAARSRSILGVARFARQSELPSRLQDSPLEYDPQQRVTAPNWIPNGLLRPSTVRAFNKLWFRAAPAHRRDELQSITRNFYPLDGVDGWNRVYGPQGFLQWQMVVPDSAEHALRTCVDALSASSTPCFLAVLKRFGPANPGPISFPMQGWTLAADMPAWTDGLAELLDRLDTVVAEAGGRIYLAKDSRLSPEMLGVMYPRLDEWRAVRDGVDPHGRFRSDMSRRLGL